MVNKPKIDELIKEKSDLLQKAYALENAVDKTEDVSKFYLCAAEIELNIAEIFQMMLEETEEVDHLLSAGNCYYKAGNFYLAQEIFKILLEKRNISEDVRTEVSESINKVIIKIQEDRTPKLFKIEIFLELPFWINLRSGIYSFLHYNYLKELVNSNRIRIPEFVEDFSEYRIKLENFMWDVGFDHLKASKDRNLKSVLITEDLKNNRVISNENLEKIFGKDKDKVFFQKMKTVIQKTYVIELHFSENKKAITLNELVDLFLEPVKEDFLKAINEFLEIYLGFFSTKNISNGVFLLSNSAFSADKARVRFFLDEYKIPDIIGFPMNFYSHPYYPYAFPEFKKESLFYEYLKKNIRPSFSRVLMGISNYFFLHSDIRIGILYLDMALESCINDFIKFFNNANPTKKKLRKIKKNHTISDFIKRDLPELLETEFKSLKKDIIICVLEFHNVRNLIVHHKMKRLDKKFLETLRETVITLLNSFEEYMKLPKIIEDSETDYIKNPVGISLELIKAGSWGKIKLFNSFSEMRKSSKKQ